MLVPFPVVFESIVTISVVMQESELTTFARNRFTRMHNFGGGFACIAMCSSASLLLCNKWIPTSFNVQTVPRSNLFDSHLNGDSPPVSLSVNGHTYNMGYYLVDGIYPDWPAFVKTIRHPYDVRTQHFTTVQESARKDIERTFGVLQKRWAIVRGPAYGWSPQHIGDIMKTCIILHNMIVEDEGPSSLNTSFDNIGVLADTNHGSISERNEYINNRYDQLHDPVKYNQLHVDLIHHHWARLGSRAA
eukprot:XP_008663989.1 uncharacterized protein LOC103642509 [Zea mays]